ncbi:MAG: hypothetical protein HYY51_00445 [Candidatus Magasanikbacteria bacterium]|nr:hypothetical protein [Candidatus Magasanikbacteria bacterium]
MIGEDRPWILGEHIKDIDLFFSYIWLNSFVHLFGRHTGRAYGKVLAGFRGYELWFYFDDRDSYEMGEHLVNRIIKEPDYGHTINREIIREADSLRSYCEKIPSKDGLKELSNEQLWRIYKGHFDAHQEYYTWCWIPPASDMFHNNFTNRVLEMLRSSVMGADEMIPEYFVTLTQPTKRSLIYTEQDELLQIAVEIEKDLAQKKLFLEKNLAKIFVSLNDSVRAMLEQHREKYHYTKYIFVAGENTLEMLVRELKDIFSKGISASQIRKNNEERLKEAAQNREALFERIHANLDLRRLCSVFGDFMVTKIYRRYAQLYALYQMDRVLKEIALRMELSVKQLRFAVPNEVEAMLLRHECNAEELQKRTERCAYYAEQGKEIILSGKEAEEIMKQTFEKVDISLSEFRGQVASPGYAKGKVALIFRAGDMKKLRDGDILVSISTDPDLLPAMKRAGAIVTEQGGVTSHAAIVSRELGIPCVIGAKQVAQVLKDGDTVEVDAKRGIIRKI